VIKSEYEFAADWPFSHDYRDGMSATVLPHKGVIVYIGGNSTLSSSTSPDNALVLNIEKVVKKIEQVRSTEYIIKVNPKDLW